MERRGDGNWATLGWDGMVMAMAPAQACLAGQERMAMGAGADAGMSGGAGECG
jgi:hypothetical protein